MARVVLLDRDSLQAGRIGAGAVALRVAARRRRRRPVRRPLVFADVRDRRRQRRGPASAQAPEGRRRGGRGEAREFAGRRGDPRRARPRGRARRGVRAAAHPLRDQRRRAPVRAGRDEDGRARRRRPPRCLVQRRRAARDAGGDHRAAGAAARGGAAAPVRRAQPGLRRRRARRRSRASASAWRSTDCATAAKWSPPASALRLATHQPQWVGRFAAAREKLLAQVPRERPRRADRRRMGRAGRARRAGLPARARCAGRGGRIDPARAGRLRPSRELQPRARPGEGVPGEERPDEHRAGARPARRLAQVPAAVPRRTRPAARHRAAGRFPGSGVKSNCNRRRIAVRPDERRFDGYDYDYENDSDGGKDGDVRRVFGARPMVPRQLPHAHAPQRRHGRAPRRSRRRTGAKDTISWC